MRPTLATRPGNCARFLRTIVCEKVGAAGMKSAGQLHALASHEAAGVHALPQAPQFWTSLDVSTHVSPHVANAHESPLALAVPFVSFDPHTAENEAVSARRIERAFMTNPPPRW